MLPKYRGLLLVCWGTGTEIKKQCVAYVRVHSPLRNFSIWSRKWEASVDGSKCVFSHVGWSTIPKRREIMLYRKRKDLSKIPKKLKKKPNLFKSSHWWWVWLFIRNYIYFSTYKLLTALYRKTGAFLGMSIRYYGWKKHRFLTNWIETSGRVKLFVIFYIYVVHMSKATNLICFINNTTKEIRGLKNISLFVDVDFFLHSTGTPQ